MANSPLTDGRTAGFTVIEVVVALAIVALAFGVAQRDLSGAIYRLGGSYRATAALALAESLLDRVGNDIPLRRGGDSGATKEGYDWTVEAQPYSPPAAQPDPQLIGYAVTVTVSWRDRGNQRQVQLTTVRLALPGPNT